MVFLTNSLTEYAPFSVSSSLRKVDSSSDLSSDEEEQQAQKFKLIHSPSSEPLLINGNISANNNLIHSTTLEPERWKALIAFSYVLLVSWLTAFTMVIVHDRVPDMEKYPPLPDLLLGKSVID